MENQAREHASALVGLTPESLTAQAKDLRGLRTRFEVARGKLLSDEESEQFITGALGCALAVALHRQGWELSCVPGAAVAFRRDAAVVQPFSVMSRLASGELSGESWRDQCQTAGIAGLDLGQLQAP